MLETPPIFTLTTERLPGDAFVVHVDGELDLYTAPQLEAELGGLIDMGATRILVDLTDVPFLDSTSLGALIAVAGRLGRKRFALTGVGLESRRVIEITGADNVLEIVDSHEGEAA